VRPHVWDRIRRFIGPPTDAEGLPEDELAAKLSIASKAALCALLATLVLGVPFAFQRKAASVLEILLVLSIVGAASYMARRGRVRLGVWFLLVAGWIVLTANTWLTGGLATIFPIYYVVLTAGAGWLLGRRAALLSTWASCAAVAVMTVVDLAGPGLPRYFPMRPAASLVVFALAMAIVALPFQQMLRSLDVSETESRHRLRQLKLTERALGTTESRHRALFSFIAEAIFVADAQSGMIVDANPAAEALIGRPLEEILTLHQTQLHPSEQAREARASFEECSRHPGIHNAMVVRPDGRRIPVEIAATLWVDPDGKRLMFCLFRDVTERKKAEDALRESEAWLSEAARVAGIAYSSWDVETDTSTWSEEMYRLTGWDPAQPAPRRAERSKVYTAESWRRLDQAVSWTLATGDPFELDLDVIRPDGAIRHTHARGAAARDRNGQVIRVYGTLQDITEHRMAQERLRQTQWSESFRVLSRGIAHDFNNLLGAILAEAEVALMDVPAGTRGSDELRRIDGLARRASEIVRQLMIYSGEEQPAIGPVDLSAVVRDILDLLRSPVSKNATLRVELGSDLPEVMADAAQLRQLIMSLVLNASEAIGEEPGVIGVTTSHVTIEDNDVAGVPAGSYLRLEVSDTGCGMSEETRARIFDPFFSTKAGGRGLGLSVVQSIVYGNRGFINVASAPGRGSRFEVLLPCGASDPADGESAARSSQPQPRISSTVLVVEDEEALRMAAAKVLARRGFAVLQAPDGNAAVDLLQSANQIDVILLDVTIPGFTSREVASKARLFHPKAKVVLTTAYSKQMVMESFEGTDICAFIRKPYRLNELVQVLQGLTGGGDQAA
jgi:PAS domain S-box-containing protein